MSKKQTLTPEMLVPRMGEYLVENKQILPDDLQRALSYQKSLHRPDQPAPLLGEIY